MQAGDMDFVGTRIPRCICGGTPAVRLIFSISYRTFAFHAFRFAIEVGNHSHPQFDGSALIFE